MGTRRKNHRDTSVLFAKWCLAYNTHEKDAKERGISFELSIDDWLEIWIKSGHFFDRGHKKGQYCMARFGDKGPYAVNNVKIILHSENVVEGLRGKPKSEQTRQRMSKPKSPEHRAKIIAHLNERSWLRRL